MQSYLKTLALVLLAMSPVIALQAFGHPLPGARPAIEPLPPPVPLVANYGSARVDFDGECLQIELPGWTGGGRVDADTGIIRVAWTDKKCGTVTCMGRYWFDENGDLVGAYWYTEQSRPMEDWVAGDRYRRLP